MGFIFKFLIITIALSWIFSKLLQFFLRSKLKQFIDRANGIYQEEQRRQTTGSRPGSGGVQVDHIPPKFKEKRNRKDDSGDYIDYEEVKD
ncbi:hypothetical protein A3SI_18969 [Nitritalea halalkaliphila LW7]|uniref:DUF4834 domain-containing protein n=1 Tax=Nitritalea halalkaliphila LW7 TaxID=1189621 RepID=I5BTV4_9BACT|nr:DUF4834 family protein [Nitritalea halalkaliphila]EIM73006.1 hypothetical protein A3SI_18969 [Nitritalea halalkaliphila LW7]